MTTLKIEIIQKTQLNRVGPEPTSDSLCGFIALKEFYETTLMFFRTIWVWSGEYSLSEGLIGPIPIRLVFIDKNLASGFTGSASEDLQDCRVSKHLRDIKTQQNIVSVHTNGDGGRIFRSLNLFLALCCYSKCFQVDSWRTFIQLSCLMLSLPVWRLKLEAGSEPAMTHKMIIQHEK